MSGSAFARRGVCAIERPGSPVWVPSSPVWTPSFYSSELLQYIDACQCDGQGYFFSRERWNRAEAEKELDAWLSGEPYQYTPPPKGIPCR